jgi:hypothetical protein
MADVFAGTGDYLARSKDIDLGPELDAIADEIQSYAIGLAAEHVNTADYANSLKVAIDRSSPSGRDRLVYSDDPAALAIEYGHHIADNEGGDSTDRAVRRRRRQADDRETRFVPGQHILGRAAEAARGTD